MFRLAGLAEEVVHLRRKEGRSLQLSHLVRASFLRPIVLVNIERTSEIHSLEPTWKWKVIPWNYHFPLQTGGLWFFTSMMIPGSVTLESAEKFGCDLLRLPRTPSATGLSSGLGNLADDDSWRFCKNVGIGWGGIEAILLGGCFSARCSC